MLFTWDTTDLCIVFRSWHVSGTFSLIVALIGIILLTAGYEAVREASRRYEAHSNKALEGRRGGDDLRGESPCIFVGLGAGCCRTRITGGFPCYVYHLRERS
jgi:hypothetical protein